jgi:uncharacterized LabA/DUF88 family protein
LRDFALAAAQGGLTVPRITTHAYIDGAFLRDRSSLWITRLFRVEPDLDFWNILSALSASRVFYYDCIEDEPRDGETQEAFVIRTTAQQGLLAKVAEANMCHVRLGTLKQRQKGRRVTQKEVDVKIAVDMLTHAAGRAIEKAILLTGDLDFRPVVESLVQSGIVVELRYDPLVTATELQQAADVRQPLRAEDWMSFCSRRFQKEHQLPRRWLVGSNEQHPEETELLQTGHLNGNIARLWRGVNGSFTAEIEGFDDENRKRFVNHEDREMLMERYLPLSEPGISWDANR